MMKSIISVLGKLPTTIILLVKFLCFVTIAICGLSVTSAEAFGPSKRLTNYLLSKHDSSAPPENVVEVMYEIELVHILNIEEIRNTMSVLVYIEEQWYDQSLSWDPKNFSMINTTWLPTDIIWIPDIIVFNMLEHLELLRSVRAPVQIEHDGHVLRTYPAIYTVMCPINVHYFPFDEQECCLDIASWGYAEDKLRLNATTKQLLQHYASNDEWALKHVGLVRSSYTHEDVVVSEVKLIVQISRKPLYYIISLVVPSYIICILSIAGLFARFSTTSERQERFTLGVTATLTMAVLSLVVAEKTPHSSEQIPLLVWYFLYNVLIITIATVTTSAPMFANAKGYAANARWPPRWLMLMLLIRPNKAQKLGKDVTQLHEEIPVSRCGCASLTSANNLNHQDIREANPHLVEIWGVISRRIDHLLTVFFLIITTLPTYWLCCKTIERYQTPDIDPTHVYQG